MKSPTSRTLERLRKEGYRAEVVEKWNAFGRVRQDLFGVIDVLGVGNGETVAVQTTSYSNVSARLKKIKASPALPDMLASGWRVIIHGWHKKGHRYECRVVEVTR